jgi:hypothetical protein
VPPDDSRPWDDEGRPRPRRRGGYRNTTLGILLLAGLIAVLGGALAWRAGRVTPPRLREALRERLDTPRSLPASTPGTEPAVPRGVPVVADTPAPVNSVFAAPPPARDPHMTTDVRRPVPSATPLFGPGTAVAATEPPPAPPASGTRAAAATAPVSSARYALELGPFASPIDAHDVERRVNEAGFATVRVRHAAAVSVYAVIIDKVGTRSDGEALVATLREQGLAAAVVDGDDATVAVRVGTPAPLRGAVTLAGRVRALGHAVRVVSQPGEAASFVVRHGSYPNRQDASETGEALKRLGLSPQIVRLR